MAVAPARAKSLFLAASDLAGPTERAAYLDRECGGDADLRARVDALLRADEAPALPPPGASDATGAFAGGTQATATFVAAATFVATADAPTADYPGAGEHAGAVIAGKYTLVEPIGEGGMGSVWRAKQTEPVKRFVAVKLIKAGMDSKTVLARFDAERQALALMDHPNIAKVLDGGLHDSRPYFVMELVKGVPITDYCDKCKLTPRQRLELFVPVCQAIQHAHQKGIIHRDIKPSNVMVALYDDKPVVKVIDFGVAKATGGALTEHTLDTGFGGVVGTPQYMSPEQATFNNLDIDTRSDVYALGVLLYELLAGSPPFSGVELKKKGLLEILRVVREEEPPRPSTKLSTADALPTLSANRGTEPKKLTGLLRNELDWIVMKALEKDRTRRYETANGFAADVLRYLAGEAVQAHPPSTAYRVKKFVRRNKGQVVAASLVLFALLAGMAGTTWQASRAERARDAEASQRQFAQENEAKAVAAAEAEKAANEQAQKRLVQIEKGNEIITSIFTDLDIRQVKAGTEPLEAVLAKRLVKAAGQLEGEAVGDPLAVASLQDSLGESLQNLGHPQDAIGLFIKARAVRTASRGADHPDTLMSMGNLASAYRDAGQLDLALPLLEETLKLRKGRLGVDHPSTLVSMANLAAGYQSVSKLDLALPLWEETLKLHKAKLGIDHPSTLLSMTNLAGGYETAGKLDQALPLFEEALKLSKAKLGADHPDTLASMGSLAWSYRTAGKLDLALPLLEETLKLRKAKLGADHPHTLVSMGNLAEGYQAAGKLDLALPLFEETLKLQKVKMGADHPSTLISMNNLAAGYLYAGTPDLALPLLEETLKLRKGKLGADHHDTLASLGNLAATYHAAGKLDLALPLFEETLKLYKAKLGADHPHTLTSMSNLAAGYRTAGKLDLALPLFQEAAAGVEKRRFQHQDAGEIVTDLIDCHERLRQFGRAEAWRRKWLAVVKERSGADSLPYAGELAALGMNLLQQKKWADAEPVLRECLALREKKQPDAWTTFNTQSLLGGALLGQKKYADAEPLLVKGYEGMKRREKTIPPPAATRLPDALDRLIELHTATTKPDEVKTWRAERAKYPTPPELAPPPREKK